MKDYITYIADIEVFKTEVEEKGTLVADFATIDEESGTVVRVPKCKVYYSESGSVAISRMNLPQITSCKLLNSIEIIGTAKEIVIKSGKDVEWVLGGKDKYLTICPLESTYVDEEGVEQTTTRPDDLVCVLA